MSVCELITYSLFKNEVNVIVYHDNSGVRSNSACELAYNMIKALCSEVFT